MKRVALILVSVSSALALGACATNDGRMSAGAIDFYGNPIETRRPTGYRVRGTLAYKLRRDNTVRQLQPLHKRRGKQWVTAFLKTLNQPDSAGPGIDGQAGASDPGGP